ncbi:MAG: EAL domain-containing protein [Candidatus Nanopelagicales bacterium]
MPVAAVPVAAEVRLTESRLDLSGMLQLLVDSLVPGVADSSTAFVVDPVHQTFRVVALAEQDADPAAFAARRGRLEGRDFPLDVPRGAELLDRDGLVVLDADPQDLHQLLGPPVAPEPPLRSVVLMPMIVDDEVVGLLGTARYAGSDAMTWESVERVRRAAAQAALVVGVGRAAARLERDGRLLDATYDALVTTDDARVVLEWSAGAEALYGITAADAVGRMADEIVPSEPVGGKSVFDIAAALATEGRWEGRMRQRRADGSAVYVDVQAFAMLDALGQGYSVACIRDVTEAVERELEDEARTDLARALEPGLLSLPTRLPIAVEGLVARLTDSGADFALVFLYDEASGSARCVAAEHRDPVAREAMRAAYLDARLPVSPGLVASVDLAGGELRLAGNDRGPLAPLVDATPDEAPAGAAPWQDLLVVPLEVDGRTIGSLAVGTDPGANPLGDAALRAARRSAPIVARYAAISALVDSLAEQSTTLDEVSDAVIRMDEATVVRGWNRAAERLYGLPRDQVVGRLLDDVFETRFEDGTPPDEMRERILGGQEFIGATRQRVPGGPWLDIELHASAVRDDDGQVVGVVSVNRDIGERLRLERGRATTEELARLLSQRLAATAGELRHTFEELAALLCEQTADLASAWTVQPDGAAARCVALRSRDPQREGFWRDVLSRHPVPRGVAPLGRVLATGQPYVLLDRFGAGAPGDNVSDETRTAIESDPQRSVVIVPMRSGDEVVGILAMSRFVGSDPFTDDDVAFLRQVADVSSAFVVMARSAERVEEQRNVLQSVSDIVVELDGTWTVAAWNGGAERTLGIPAAEVLGRQPIGLFPDIEQLGSDDPTAGAEAMARGEPWSARFRLSRPDGRQVIVDALSAAVVDEEGSVRRVVAVGRDVTDLVRAQDEAEARQRFVEAVLDGLPGQTCVLDRDGVVVAANQGFRLALDDRSGPVGTDYLSTVESLLRGAGRDPAPLLDTLRSVLSGDRPHARAELAVNPPDLDSWVALEATPLADGSGAVVTHLDITTQKVVEHELERAATHDPLTGLANRRLLHVRLSAAMQRCADRRSSLALLFVDLDRFKSVNDTHGHSVGDDVLQATADRLRRSVRAGDTVARVSGDEFVVVMEDLTGPDPVQRLAELLLARLAQPIPSDGSTVAVSASIGVTFQRADDLAEFRSGEDLVSVADDAMYDAKAAGRAQIRWAGPTVSRDGGGGDEIERVLRDLLRLRTLAVAGQPVQRADGGVAGVELLLRLDARHGLDVLQVLRAAERGGLLRDLTDTLLERACREIRRRPGLPADAFVSLNLSHPELLDPRLVSRVSAALDRHGIEPARLVLEITEGALLESPDIGRGVVRDLDALGVRVALDDVGQGTSSLTALLGLPLHFLKLDSTALALETDAALRSRVLSSMTSLASALGARTVAERVSDEQQRADAVAAGIDLLQGYAIAPPVLLESLDD